MPSPRSALVVGGGIIGCSLARELAGAGVRTTVVERGAPGGEASTAAAGLLSPQSEAPAPGPFFDLALASRDLHPVWAAELAKETGIDVGYRRTGILRCETSPAGAERADSLESRVSWQRAAGLPLEEVGVARIAALSGGLVAPGVARAFWFPEDGVVDPVPLVEAVVRSAERRGARILSGRTVQRFLVERGACVGVETEGGVRFAADCVVDAAGAWAALDRDVLDVPVEPVRGQMVELRPVRALPTVAWSEDVYLVPRTDGRVLAGSTEERVGYVRETTAEAVDRLVGSARRLVPDLAEAAFSRAWAGLRPASADGLPILGATSVPGLWLATGHYRNGILLAPVTARLLARAIVGETRPELAPFSPDRFPAAAPRTGGRARENFG
jgi:glycine oxidase